MDLNPEFTKGVKGTVAVSSEMEDVRMAGGTVVSPLPDLPHIRKTLVLRYVHGVSDSQRWYAGGSRRGNYSPPPCLCARILVGGLWLMKSTSIL